MVKHLLIVCFFLLSGFYLQGQVGEYSFRNLTSKEGLSQSSVIEIKQDRLGQMWFGTRDGLNIYDGENFKIFRNDPEDSTSISNSDILSIMEAKDGKVWIGTYNGLNQYDPVRNSFTRHYHSAEDNSLSHNTIWTLKEINDEIWIGTSNGLSIYNKQTNSFLSFYHSTTDNNSLSSNYITKILQAKNGDIWVGTSNGFNKLSSRVGDQLTFKRFGINKNDLGVGSMFIQDIIEDNQNNIWIATKKHGLLQYSSSKNTIKHLSKTKKFQGISTDIRALNFDKQGNLWIGTQKGIAILTTADSMINLVDGKQDVSSLSKVKSIFTDTKGSVWIGSYFGGVSMWDPINTNFKSITRNNYKNSLQYNVVGSIVSDQKNKIYFGTEGGGITCLNLTNGNTYVFSEDKEDGIVSDNVKSLYLTKDDKLWIGSFTQGISLVDLKTKKRIDYTIAEELRSLLRQTGVYAIQSDGKNSIWFGTFGKGLIQYNTISKELSVFDKDLSKDAFLSNNRIRNVLVDSANRVWVGTQSGLNFFYLDDIGTDRFHIEHYFYDVSNNSGIDILTVFEDSRKNIWVGTKGNGFYYFNGNEFTKELMRISDRDVSSIRSVIEDKKQNLWLGSNQGILKYNPLSKELLLYDQTDGLISNEFNNGSALNFNDQTFYFGGLEGVTFFDPDGIESNQYAPQVILTDLKIQNNSVGVDDESQILDKSISYTKNIELSYDKANFSVEFAIPSFVNSTNNMYSFRLKGLEDAWITSNKNEVSYTIQNPGTYIFEVKGANNNGLWNETPTTLEIVVNPAPWRSIWAFILYGIVIALSLIGLIFFLKSKAKLKHELELEHLENERNEEINKTKLEFFTNISHEFRTPLTLILGPLQQVLMEYKGSNQIYKKLLVIENSANHLLQLINRLMDFRKLENNQFKLQSAEGNIVKFLREIYLSFTEYAKIGKYTYTFETSDEEILVYYDRAKLERVFFNLISNAFRYTPKKGTIDIKVKKESNSIIIEVLDSGVGIAEEHKDKIFDRFFEIPIHNEPEENYNKGTGIGLSIANNIIKLHHGTIAVRHNDPKGSVFVVTLPLGRDHLSESEILKDFKISDDLSQYESQLKSQDFRTIPTNVEISIDKEKPTILVVEDNQPLRQFIKNILIEDYNILEAQDGEVAMKKTLKHLPDLVISDVIMPKMVGTELCSKIKENIKTSHIPVILLTARTSLIYKFEGLESGADEYISKPFNILEFKLKIKNILDSVFRLKEKFSVEDNFLANEIAVSSIDEELLKKAYQIVEENIDNDQFDVPYFCSELGVSRTMLFTKIKAWTNFTPNEFIHEIRMKRAAQLLEQDKIIISQISYKVGFKNPKYFSKCFQKKYGITPTQYQKKFFYSE